MISLLHPEQWLSDEMGEAGSHAAEHSSDRPRAIRLIPTVESAGKEFTDGCDQDLK